MTAAVSLKNVRKIYKRGSTKVPIFSDFSFAVEAGSFVALMGPSGSGKTTLLNLICGLDRADAGEISVAGANIARFSRRKMAAWRARNIGFIFQSYNLIAALNVRRNVELPLLLTHLASAERARRVEIALKLVGLDKRMGARPSELSGGEQQRVAIARAIIADPALLACDEPTGDLDRATAEQILGLLRILNREHGKTIIMVTHDPKAADYADRQFHLDKGVLSEAGEGVPA